MALLPPPSSGFPPLPPSVSAPLTSSSLLSDPLAPSFSSLPPFCSSSSAVQAASLVVASSSSSSSSDFASYQASVLGLSHNYQCLAHCYFQSGGSDFRAYLSAFYRHLSFDASRGFASGSSVFFSALRSVAASVPLPSVSSLSPPVSSAALVFSQFPAPLPSAPPFSTSSSFPLPSSLGSLSVAQGWGASVLGSASVVSSAPPGFPPLSARSSVFSVPPASTSSLPPAAPLLALPSTSFSSSDPSLAGFAADGSGGSSVGSGSSAFPLPPFHGFWPSVAFLCVHFCSAGLRFVWLRCRSSGFALAAYGSASVRAGFAPQPGPSSSLPLRSEGSAALSAPPLLAFAYPPEDPFAPGFADPEASGSAVPDPEAPVPPPLSDSIRAEVCRMHQYLVDLFPQAVGSSQAPPPRALFEEFFAPPPSPHQPVYLAWFERVRSALSQADSRLASLLASGRPESSLLSPRNAQYSVSGEALLGSAAPVNPSLLAIFERPLCPSLHLGLMIREAALLEASSRALSESLSHAMWLLSGLLVCVRLQGFSPSDALLFNTLVTSLSKCLAHQASISASHTAFVGLKLHQFYLSYLPAYFSDVHKRAMLAAPRVCADSLFAESDIFPLLSDTQTSSLRLSRLWWMWPPPTPVLGVAVLVLLGHRLALCLRGGVAESRALLLARPRESDFILRLLLPL